MADAERARNRARFAAAGYQAQKAWSVRNRDKKKAHWTLNNAIVQGKMVKPTRCERCRKRCVPHAHHASYKQPLDVTWLCRRCHIIEHRSAA